MASRQKQFESKVIQSDDGIVVELLSKLSAVEK